MTGDLINTLESPGEFDALTTLRPGEPYFPLVGRDRLAPPLVQQWADENRKRALTDFSEGKITAEERDRELRKSSQAEAIGWSMVSYKAGHEEKEAEQRGSNQPSYSGYEAPASQIRRDQLISARVRTADALWRAVGEARGLLEMVEGELAEEAVLFKIDDCADDLRKLVDTMKAVSDRITPKRAGMIA